MRSIQTLVETFQAQNQEENWHIYIIDNMRKNEFKFLN
jgi:hypothetical protein